MSKLTRYAATTIFVLLLGFVLIDAITVTCIKSEDTCYYTHCYRGGCYDVVTRCDNVLVRGHKVMCVEKQHFWDTPVTSAHS